MAFHPYPRLIPSVFNRSGFGPPQGLTPASAWPRVDHPASRLRRATGRVALFRLAFAAARQIAWPRRAPQLAGSFYKRHAVTPPSKGRSDCLWAHGFRRCFTPLSGCFSPFPHGTRPLSVIRECSALEGGPPSFGPGFTCPGLLGDMPGRPHALRVRGSHPVSPAFPCRSAARAVCNLPGGLDPSPRMPRNPGGPARRGSTAPPVWARALSLAATRAFSFDFSSSGYLDVSVPPVAPSRPMRSGGRARAWPRAGFPIRRSADRRPFAPPRGLSQLATSFFGSGCQGIHRAPSTSSGSPESAEGISKLRSTCSN